MNYRCILIVAAFSVFSPAHRLSAAEKPKAEQKTHLNAEPKAKRKSEAQTEQSTASETKNRKNVNRDSEPKAEQKSGTRPKSDALFKRIDISSSSSFRFNAADFDQAAAGTACAMRALFRDADLRFYEAVSDIALPNFSKASAHLPQYGAALSFNRMLPFPLTVKAGTLSPGGSFSRLVSPAPSFSASPFAKSFSTKTGVASSLPSSGGEEKEFALAADIRFPEKIRRFAGSGASFFYRQDGIFAASADMRINLPLMMSAAVSFTGGSFFLKNNASSWFSEIAFFKPAKYSAFALQALFSTPNLTSLFTVNLYDQPSGKPRLTYRSENAISFGGFTLLASAFASDGRGIITPNGAALNTLRQFRIAPQYTHRFSSPRFPALTVGAAGVIRQKYVPSDNTEQTSVKCGCGLQYSDKKISSRLTFETDGIEFSKTKKTDSVRCTLSGKFSQKTEKIGLGIQVSGTFSKKSAEESCKISIAHSKKNLTVSGNAGFSFKQKNGEYGGGAASLGFSASHTTKFIKYTFRLSAAGKY
ncbi:hypothetical protein [Treponema socranskii]|uniref:hypothetical protein n=1 Tax=Treponema socranskii TaxID=53419 RepID=UPI0028E64561|nr:hypothetical protein [Treponema socranskii]